MLTNTRFSVALIRNPFLILFCLFFLENNYAQKATTKPKRTYFGIGIELARPVGTVSENYHFGLGGSALLEVKVSQPIGITFSLSYIKYEEHWGGGYNGSHIDELSALIGGRYYFNKYFFISGQVGLDVHQDLYSEIGGSAIVAPGLGAKWRKLDVTAKYMTASRGYGELSNLSLRVAVAL